MLDDQASFIKRTLNTYIPLNLLCFKSQTCNRYLAIKWRYIGTVYHTGCIYSPNAEHPLLSCLKISLDQV